MIKRKWTLLAGVMALTGIAIGAWRWFGAESPQTPTATNAERKVLYWHDPMVPGFKSNKPGKSPFMDMELVPVYEGEDDKSVVTVRPEIAASIGIRTHKATRAQASRRIEAQGYLLRDSGSLQVSVDVFDRDADAVRPGQTAEVRIPAVPGRTWQGVVQRTESDISIGLRSVKVIVRIQGADAELRSNQYAEVTMHASISGQRLLVPSEALIRTGRRTAVVLALGEGRFQPVEVSAGAEYGDTVEILQGIKEGDTVVTSGQFLIDSESNVRSSFERMQAPASSEDKP